MDLRVLHDKDRPNNDSYNRLQPGTGLDFRYM